MSTLLDQLVPFSPSLGAARAAFGCYCMIAVDGFEVSKSRFTRATWYRHIRILREAGFSLDDLKQLNATRIEQQSKLPKGVVLVSR